jgi:Resolvase, N terminal domain
VTGRTNHHVGGPPSKALLDEVRSQKIDIIVVYKVDRLTQSLADFAKLVELFDAHDVSFVSVTQSLQYDIEHGASDPQRAFVLRTVRAGGAPTSAMKKAATSSGGQFPARRSKFPARLDTGLKNSGDSKTPTRDWAPKPA